MATSSERPSLVGRGAVAGSRQRDPGLHFIGRGVNDCETRLLLVGGEGHTAVPRYRNALDLAGDGNHSERFARFDVEHGHGAGADIGGVAAGSVGRDGEHVRFLLPGGDRADDFESARVDERHILIEFGGHVEQSIVFVIDHAMGTDAVAEVDVTDDFARRQIDDQHLVSIEPGHANADIAIDGNVGDTAVGRCSGFMAVHDGHAFRDGRDLLFARGIDQADIFISLVDDDEKRHGAELRFGRGLAWKEGKYRLEQETMEWIDAWQPQYTLRWSVE